MNRKDQIAVWLAVGTLNSDGRDIEALTLESIATEATEIDLDTALAKASVSQRTGGAFGMEILGAVLIPVLISAARQVFEAYEKEILEKLGKAAADATVDVLKAWWKDKLANDGQAAYDRYATAIRAEGEVRGLSKDDIEALVAAAAPTKLPQALAENGP